MKVFDLAINVLFMITLAYIYDSLIRIYVSRKMLTAKNKCVTLWFILLTGMFISLLFPLSLSNNESIYMLIYPVILAGLYTGWRGGAMMSLPYFFMFSQLRELNVYHYFILIIVICLYILGFYFFHPLFKRNKIIKKLIITTGMITCSLAYVLFFTFIGEGVPLQEKLSVLLFYNFCIGLLIVNIERILEYQNLLRQVMKTEKMEVVSQLAASVSHEVRNPLTATKGFLDLALETPADSSTPVYLKYAREEVYKAEKIINDYLQYAKPAPTLEEKINVQAVVQHVIAATTSYASQHSVKIVQSTERCYIWGELNTFEQAVINTIKNGIEAMTSGGILNVAINVQDSTILLTVTDEGKGMTAEEVDRLGEPYYSTKSKGTGLGSMIIFRAVEALQGKIYVESEKNKGTSFVIQLPAYIEQQ